MRGGVKQADGTEKIEVPEIGAATEVLARRIAALPCDGARTVVALTGPPGAGKSTVAAALVARLNRDGPVAALVPMDGFHLDNTILEMRGLITRKGAPETFDADGFVHLVRRLHNEAEVVFPTFDRARDIALAGAHVLTPDARIAVVEGNYLLLDEAPWRDLAPLWDLSVFLPVDMGELERRLVERWLEHGLPEAEARAKAKGNDLANARRVMETRLPPDIELLVGAA